ncbi:hypothetical protein BO71DRAFT_480585 [Aspergillus ellipticus CBS 707.79]|uniref:MFS general substrate transporter n=1 Tax=Aspergillus ellipticus CBS 707.79 TaxID=1448320 RepID=A0A319DKZ9_9EURO|nr:hypothetical protein BO71DRAFT_480585 [Aspergillus ellipticus CBS 707.79]
MPDRDSAESVHEKLHEDVVAEKEKDEIQNPGADDDEDEPQYPGPSKLFIIVLGLNLALFLVGLDNKIISNAIPKITDHFHVLNDLFTFYSVKWVFLAGLFVFEQGSLVCGVAPTSTTLIVGRAVAGGIGGGGLPIWFQAIKDASTIKFGIMNLPMIISFVIASVSGGILTSMVGYYVPFTYLTVLLGLGVGFGLQSAFAPCQTVLPLSDVALGTSIIMFCENLGGAIMESVATNVFTNQLVRNIAKEGGPFH